MSTDEEGGTVARLAQVVGALPAPRQMAAQWTPAQVQAQLAAQGKALLALGMACGIASGQGFLHWRCDRPRRVLVIDGEMPGELIRQRAIDELRRCGIVPAPGNLVIYARDMEEAFAERYPDLPSLEHHAPQDAIDQALLLRRMQADRLSFDTHEETP